MLSLRREHSAEALAEVRLRMLYNWQLVYAGLYWCGLHVSFLFAYYDFNEP